MAESRLNAHDTLAHHINQARQLETAKCTNRWLKYRQETSFCQDC